GDAKRVGIVFKSHQPRRCLQILPKRLIVKSPSGCLVERVGERSKNWWKQRFAKTRRIVLVLYEMHFDGLRRLLLADHPVLVEIVLLRHTIYEGQFSE